LVEATVPRLVKLAFCTAAVAASALTIVYSGEKPVVFAAAVVAALAMFTLRETDRAAYGAIEILFSLGVLWKTAGEAVIPGAPSAPPIAEYEWDVILLQIGAATYVLVRGLDNFTSGLKIWRARSEVQPNGGP
jgi:hypothetical protein